MACHSDWALLGVSQNEGPQGEVGMVRRFLGSIGDEIDYAGTYPVKILMQSSLV